ncbi:MAG: DUF2442 domain-containing protein [Okeania sp. SIO3H1]|uniref:DUF2442 domain-containing protein n=1 Tax=Okeania sp. SIO1I7 TaxID=2607772 RepID=UPI0013C7532D|nr:DUF2442 domain-containing protein [Okeania sp. SIO1I7]NEN92534.1 DUF2442 domain-containing protein [Okeania sp. SIO3H1]NET26089.1 DUF2442 domain-containing protein [Okeania sp. SIO1I7]
MSISTPQADERVKNVQIQEDTFSVELMDGRTITVPLAWYPRLLKATPEQLQVWEICGGGYGIHWEEIDEDISTEGLLRGAPAPGSQLRSLV